MSLTLTQKVALASVTLSALAGATAQLTPLFGATVATDIASVAALGGTIVSGWIFVLTGQAATVSQVAAMPGVERITVNPQATPAVAQIATDPAQLKVGTKPEDRAAVVAIAKTA